MAENGDFDRVAEIRQRLEAATGRRLAAAAIAHPNGADLRTADLAAHAPDDLAWLLSRLAVVEAERDELRATVAKVERLIEAQGDDSYVMSHALRRALSGTTEGPS